MVSQAVLPNGSANHRLARPKDDQRPRGLIAIVGTGTPEVVPIQFSRNAAIYREGAPVCRLYKVVDGAVRTCRLLPNGRRQIGAFYIPGDIFGLETESEHLFSAEAVVESEILVVEPPLVPFECWEPQEASPTWELIRLELRRTRDRVLLLGKTAHERVASFLLEMADRMGSNEEVKLPMPRQDIADYLGLTLETVCRMLTQLDRDAPIAIAGSKHIMLRKRAALRRLADVAL
jgi:CRP/FNR family transcriptional regulator, nitrogen fixation regulation protein